MIKHKAMDFFGFTSLSEKNFTLVLQTLAVIVLVFIGLACLVQTGFWNQMDMSFSIEVHELTSNVVFDKISAFINDYADVVIWYDLGFILCIPKKTRKLGILLIATELLASVLLEGSIKLAVARIRPYQYLNMDTLTELPTGYSFPSGHSTSAFIAATVIWIYNKSAGKIMFVVAAFFGFMRIYIFAHFLTDVFAGAVLGIGISIIVYLVLTEAWVKFFDLSEEKPLSNR